MSAGVARYALWVLLVLAALRAQAADVYRLDAGNTQVSFAVQRFGIPWVSARFRQVSGELVLDRRGPSARVHVIVGISSVDCNDPRWNERLRSPEWLDAQRYPLMTFDADHIDLGQGRATATGQLSLHGLTHGVALNVTFLDCQALAPCRFAAQARVRRSEYGLPHGLWSGGDQVDISISGTVTNRSE